MSVKVKITLSSSVMHWCKCLSSLFSDAEDPEVTFSQLLSFFTGSEYPPPLGFHCTPSLRFTSDSEFPLASTCALELTLPTKHYGNPDLFREKMVYGLKNHGGFGLL